ncbi:MAG: hypothetical protein PHW22_00870 [Bacilli bacterium]|nr:hypothetical protein [Bacilli bacterium]
MEKPISALEITSSGVKLAVGYVYQHDVYILHALESSRARLVKGNILDRDEMIIAIKELVNQASKELDIKIESVVLGLPSNGLEINSRRGETNTTDPSSKICDFDASNCISMINKQKGMDKVNKKLIDIVPYKYILDDNVSYEHFPKNKVSKTIAMIADVEFLDQAYEKMFTSVVTDAGLKIDKEVNVTNAAIKYLSSFDIKVNEYVFIHIGGRMTTLGFAYDNRLAKAQVINFGSEDITDEIAREFNVSREKADYYKKVLGIDKNPDFDFVTADGFSVEDLARVIKKSLDKLVNAINDFLIGIEETARNLFILSGGGSNLYGLDNFLAYNFQNKILRFTPYVYGARNKSYTNCVSLIKYFAEYEIHTSPSRPYDLTLTRISPIIDKKGGSHKKKIEDLLDTGLDDEVL